MNNSTSLRLSILRAGEAEGSSSLQPGVSRPVEHGEVVAASVVYTLPLLFEVSPWVGSSSRPAHLSDLVWRGEQGGSGSCQPRS
jgi:hypothetical protein